MAARPTFTPIRLTRPLVRVDRAAVIRQMGGFGSALANRMARYPTQRPNVRYRRTGNLGRRWAKRGPQISGTSMTVTVINNSGYAQFPQGFISVDPKQLGYMASYGWQSIETQALALWNGQYRPNIVRIIQGA